jgi:phosphonate transport system substrate-binding protein
MKMNENAELLGSARAERTEGGVSRRKAALALWAGLAGAAAPGRVGSQPAPAVAPAKPLEMGLLPNLSVRVLMAQYQPLRDFLGRELKRPVQISTASSWSSFHLRTLALEYDVVVTAVNMARVAQLDKGYVPLLTYAPDIKGLLAFANARPIKSTAELSGQTLVMSNPQSLLALRGLRWLAENGLVPGRDFKTINIPTDDSVGNVLVRGEARAALLSGGEFRAIPEALRTQITVLTTFAEVPGFVVLANPRMPAAERQALQAQWLAFGAGSEEGKAFFAASGFTGIREVPAGLMESMDAYVESTRRVLAGP